MKQIIWRWFVALSGTRRLFLAAILLATLVPAGVWVGLSRPVPGQSPLLGLRGGSEQLRGVIAEVLPAGGYRYARLRLAGGGEAWVVTLGASPAVGAAVEARSFGRRDDFESPRLQRRFARLYFGLLRAL